ncbi:MAG: TonB-dependent receptor [Saprospiraceae bacterium]|nr:TonB-dependent receptor [Saprospiraceae bacterium]
MSFKNFINIILCLLATSSFAQTIKGSIKSQSGETIGFANISVLNSANGTVADKDGNFTLDLKRGKYELQFSTVGYASKVQQINVEEQTLNLEVSLSENDQSLGEVVVTADKVETNLQKTPIAVTVLNAKKIEEYRVWNMADITALAPSVFTIEHGNSTGSNFLNFRGAMGFTNEQAVATYVDGVYQFDFFSAPLNFNNIERIEILRGPQGTLYGRNAFSGVFNVVTKKPSNATSGTASFDFGNYGQQRYSASFNTPLIKNRLFMNVGLQLNKRGSVYENPTQNTKNFDSKEAISGNLGLKYLVSDKWTIDLSARIENNTDKGAYPWVVSDSIARNAPYKAFGNWDNTEKRSNVNTAIAIKYFGDKFNFTSITSGIDFNIWFPNKFDYDFTGDKLLSGKNSTHSNQFTQEFRFSSPASANKLKWSFGSYLFGEKTTTEINTYYEEVFALFDPNAPYTTITNGKRNAKGIAFFGQASYELSSKLDITIGTRYDTENRELTQNSSFEKDGITTLTAPDTTISKTFTAFTPKVILNYKVNENSILYASYAKGFRVGGFNFNSTTNPTYNPEKSDNYEVGIKNNLWNNKLKVNLTAFYFQQKDQQVTTTKDGVNYATLNVGNMNNLGFEAEITAIPVKNLQVEWTASTSNSKYEKLELFDAVALEVKNYKGNKAIYNPAFQSMLALQYGIPFENSKQNVSAFVRGEFRYLDEYQLNFENTESQKGYGIFNARAGVTSKNIDIALWVRNLNDARYLAWGTYASYMLGSPRMWGVTLTAKF